jgi:nitroreductase
VDAETRFVPLQHVRLPPAEMLRRARALRQSLASRRSVRVFSSDPVPLEVVDECVRVAGSAPSGANRQPWSFVVVTDPALKRAIREGAEAEEREFYERRITDEWRRALAPFGTTWEKPFLEEAPALIVVFRHTYDVEEGEKRLNYYTVESVGIAVGFLIAALHQAGLATLTHTPSPMRFLGEILGRPVNEKPFVLLPVGFPADDCQVPELPRKDLEQIRMLRCGRYSTRTAVP